jgi:hypothetical protein
VEDFLADPGLAGLGLREAASPGDALRPGLAPKKRGLNIEGLASVPGTGALLVGFRNPVPGGRALVIPLLNPGDVALSGEQARFGPPALLDLGGMGVRCMEFVEGLGAFLLIAGGRDGSPGFRAFAWKGGQGDPAVPLPRLDARIREAGITPEAVALFPREGGLLVLSDDGDRTIRPARGEPCPCKRAKLRRDRRFRGLWVDLDERICGSGKR